MVTQSERTRGFAPSCCAVRIFAARSRADFQSSPSGCTSSSPVATPCGRPSSQNRHAIWSSQSSSPSLANLRKPLFPLVFCRQCGTAYYRVATVTDAQGRGLAPREDRREEGDDAHAVGYLYVSSVTPWPTGDGQALLNRLPAFMKETTADGTERIRADARGDLPETVFVDATGRIVAEGKGIPAALIRQNFLFCLEPSCGVAYAKSQRSERAKLATLGVDNRSTATTVLAVRALIELQSDVSLNPEARKLLSFTDNRQDASLQAGHFNDFTQVALLRSALHKAPQAKGETGLTHAELSRSVFDALSLPFRRVRRRSRRTRAGAHGNERCAAAGHPVPRLS